MKRIILLAVLAVLVTVFLVIGECEAEIFARWVELGPDGSSTVRVVTDNVCPTVMFDGSPVAMRTRSDSGVKFQNVKPAEFPVHGCEVAVPAGATSAVVEGRALPLARPNPQRIAILGDTGCRLQGATLQDCNDPQSWPFPRIAADIAAARPDLVIHVGDYHYRENACPAGRAGCSGTPWGYGWDAWNADFFAPAAPLFNAAPWVLVRGNHEDCDRAGEGWFRFLDRMPMETACRDLSGIFVARLGDFGVILVDGAKAADPKGDPGEMSAALRQQLEEVLPKLPPEAWFATHRPLDAVRAAGGAEPSNVVDNKVQELAFGPIMPSAVSMLVAGHIPFFQAIDFGGVRPPQLVVGTGGDALSPMPPLSVAGSAINGGVVKNSVTYSGFGYMIWDRSGSDWVGTLFDTAGKPLRRCRLAGRSLACGS
jgi:Calcineurin-like phosphoesterase